MYEMIFGQKHERFMQGLKDSVGQQALEPGAIPLYSLFDQVGNGMAVVENNIVIYANEAFKTIFGSVIEHRTPIARLSDAVAQSMQGADMAQIIAQGRPARVEFQSLATRLWYDMGLSPVDDAHMILVCTDISVFRRRDELLSFASKMEALGQLVGGVAHDFNNILSIIEGYARLIQKQTAALPIISGHSERILLAAQRGTALTRQLLTLGRHQVVADGVTCLNDFLEGKKNLLMPLLDVRINLTIDCPAEKIYVRANADTLAQMLINAVTNARDAMEQNGGQLMIVATVENDMAVLAIHDTGCGMDEATRKQAMEPFFTTKPVDKGTGLGLTQIYGLMQQIGGEVDLYSEPGQGTTLVMRLPLGEKAEAGTETPFKAQAGTWDGQTVLIVDDEPDLVTVLTEIMKGEGFNVLHASSGNEALAVQDAYDGDIAWLLSDVVMGDMSGPKLGELIASVRPETKMIYMSGYPATGKMARIQLPEDALFLAKPIDPQHVLNIMAKLRHADGTAQNTHVTTGMWEQRG